MPVAAVQAIKFRFGALVWASDGEAGTLIQVAVQPGQRRVTLVGVKLPGGTRVAVPIERIVDATADAVRVAMTREALLQTLRPIPTEATVFSSATRVQVGGRSGNLTQITVNTADASFRRLGFRSGLSGEALAEASWITVIGDDGTITLTVPSGAALVPYRADADVAEDARAALNNYYRLRIDLRAVSLRVIDGEAWLLGNVSSTLNRRVSAELLEDIKGLSTIHNDLIADPDLAVTVARALASDPRTHGQPIGVYPVLGKVFLRGRTLTQTAAEAASQVAGQVSGLNTVVNQLAVAPQATYIPVLAPVTGNEDIIPGGD